MDERGRLLALLDLLNCAVKVKVEARCVTALPP
jgi:hypothetical protein